MDVDVKSVSVLYSDESLADTVRTDSEAKAPRPQITLTPAKPRIRAGAAASKAAKDRKGERFYFPAKPHAEKATVSPSRRPIPRRAPSGAFQKFHQQRQGTTTIGTYSAVPSCGWSDGR